MEQSSAIKIIKETESNFKEQDQKQIWKSMVSYSLANEKSYEVLKKHGVEIKKPSQVIVLLIEPEELDRELKLAEEMGFVDAYKQNPRHLTQPVEMVIKRMAKADAVGVTYKNEKGVYASFIFSERAFNYIINKNEDVKKVVDETPRNDQALDENVDLAEVKEDAMRVLETFALTDKKDEIMANIDMVASKDLGKKEILFEALKSLGDEKILLATIDEILAQSDGMKRGMTA